MEWLLSIHSLEQYHLPVHIFNLNSRIINLKQIIKDFKGDKHLELIIYETSEKIKITMPSKKFKIDISNDLLKRLEKEQISYKLNWYTHHIF